MPNRPRPVPTPKAFDVFKPGKGIPSPTSRPVIVSHKPQVQDSTLVETHGSPVPNAHQGRQPNLQSLSRRQVAPSAHAIHHGSVTTPPPDPDPTTVEPVIESSKEISHTGHIIARPSGRIATNHAALLHHKVSPPQERVKLKEPEKPNEPSLAAVPITPVEQPVGLVNAKTEGKEELLAAMPVEIRRSVANAEGKPAADWTMPPEVVAQAVPVSVESAAAPAEAVAVTAPTLTNQPSIPKVTATAGQAESAAAPAAEQNEQVVQSVEDTPMPLIKTDRKRSSDVIVFIIMLVLFLGLGTVVALLFITGTISI